MTEKPDLIQVLNHYDILARDGRTEQLTLCVAHSESTPSMSVNVIKGLVHCHACGFKGDSLSIIMEREQIGYRAAVEFAAKEFGTVPSVPAGQGRRGLSGEARSGRGGFKPAFRKGLRRSPP